MGFLLSIISYDKEVIMNKRKYIFVAVILAASIISWFNYRIIETAATRKDLADCAIRFHVLANSDSAMDQQLKMKVKENVVDYIYKSTGNFDSVDETRTFLIRNDKTIRNIARNTISSYGFDYEVSSDFGISDFPVKSYGDITFPEGSYTSYTLSIGKGKGHNWWCVLYPPLCFVDASTGIVPDSSKEMLHESLTDQEYHSIVKYRFKYLTFLNKYID